MTIGFKTGPGNFEMGKRIVDDDGARFCEVWFNVLKADEYAGTFDWFQKRGVQMGLHHWGVAGGDIKTNLMTHNERVRDETLRQMKETIDIAAETGAVYVNVHPGARRLETIDFDRYKQELIKGSETAAEKAEENLLSGAVELEEYARGRSMLLTIETIVGKEHMDKSYETVYDPGTASLDMMKQLAGQGNWIANDITHTAGQCALADGSRGAMWECVTEFTREVFDQTRLLHVNTVREPFDGTDSHDGILPEDFAEGVFPSESEMRAWLELFAEREDVFAIPEPERDMRLNYQRLRDMMVI